MIEFEALALKRSPNQYLLAPEGLCPRVRRYRASDTYHVPADELERELLAIARAEPRTRVTESDPARRKHKIVQRSRVFRFPDDIDVQIFERGAAESTLAIYSRARYGWSDMGVNAARVKRWLPGLF